MNSMGNDIRVRHTVAGERYPEDLEKTAGL